MITNEGREYNKVAWNYYNSENIIKSINFSTGWNDYIDENINNSVLDIKNLILKLKNKNLGFEMEIITNQEKSSKIAKIPKKFKAIEEKFKHAKER